MEEFATRGRNAATAIGGRLRFPRADCFCLLSCACCGGGAEAVERAREIYPALRVIVMSGQPLAHALPDDVTFFAKPFYAIELIREVSAGHGHWGAASQANANSYRSISQPARRR